MVAWGPATYGWPERFRDAQRCLIPWIEAVYPLSGRTVLEYGCGAGAISCAFAPHVERHIGFDIDAEAVGWARGHVREHGLDNVELHAFELDRIIDEVAACVGEIDVFLLYAVLEHLTVAERLAVLELGRLVKQEGVIVVCELPNRLIAADPHTSQLPFFSQLPDELALRYFDRSGRKDFTDALVDASREGKTEEALTRWGRGVSFHEFELVFGDLRRHVLASNYDMRLLPVRPVRPDELALATLLAEVRPDLAPAWSRYWQDVILSPQPMRRRPSFVRPWTMETAHSPSVASTRWGVLELLPGARLQVTLPTTSRRLLVGVRGDRDAIDVAVNDHDAAITLRGEPDEVFYGELLLPRPMTTFELTMSAPGYLHFLGYEEPG